MRLHENKELFRDAVTFTAQQKGLPEIYIEKDYWVTFALRRIFEEPSAEYTVFKGGTALSKCFTYINRFSEDIDLVVVRDAGISANRLKDRLKQISNVVSELIPEIEVPGITNKKGMIRKTVHSYSKVFDGNFGQVRGDHPGNELARILGTCIQGTSCFLYLRNDGVARTGRFSGRVRAPTF